MESDCHTLPAFIAAMDELTERTTDPQTCVAFVQHALAHLLSTSPCLTPEQTAPTAASYARHLLYRHPQDRYVMVAMVWLPGQGTPIHDHGGVWCVEGVYQGRMRVTQYDVVQLDAQHVRATPVEQIDAGLGSVGALIPPYEYHTIDNTSPETAITIHVYGANLRQCHVFVETVPGIYSVQTRDLRYTSTPTAVQAPAAALALPR